MMYIIDLGGTLFLSSRERKVDLICPGKVPSDMGGGVIRLEVVQLSHSAFTQSKLVFYTARGALAADYDPVRLCIYSHMKPYSSHRKLARPMRSTLVCRSLPTLTISRAASL